MRKGVANECIYLFIGELASLVIVYVAAVVAAKYIWEML